MNPIKPKLLTAISMTLTTHPTAAAVYVRIDSACVPDPEAFCIVGDANDLSREFMTQYARVGIDGMTSGKRMEVAAANPNSSHANQGLSGRY